MKNNVDSILGKAIRENMKKAAVESQTASGKSPFVDISKSLKNIRMSLAHAKLGSNSAIGKIESELDAIEGAVNEIKILS